jgi:hypothetical protein
LFAVVHLVRLLRIPPFSDLTVEENLTLAENARSPRKLDNILDSGVAS